MAKIREDLVGVVSVNGVNLAAGDVVPDGVTVGGHVLAAEAKPVVEDKPEPVEAEAETEKPKRRGRPRKTEGE